MKNLKYLLISLIAFLSILNVNQITNAQEKIIIKELIKGTKGVEGKKFSYPRWKQAELRFLKVIIPAGKKTPIHKHPAPMIVHVFKGRLKHTRGDVINYFRAGETFIESNYGKKHFVENVGNVEAVLFVSVSSVVGMPTTINE